MFKHIYDKELQKPGYIVYHADWCKIVNSNTCKQPATTQT